MPESCRYLRLPATHRSDFRYARTKAISPASIPRTVATAAKVHQEGAAELIAAVDAGIISVSAAADVATRPKEEQREIVARGEKEMILDIEEVSDRRIAKNVNPALRRNAQ